MRSREYSALYKTPKWKQVRKAWLKLNPWCAWCGPGKIATIADHIIPHKGNEELFWDTTNLQSLCKHCHDSVKKRLENNGEATVRTGIDGYPEGW